jgi:TonB family protein
LYTRTISSPSSPPPKKAKADDKQDDKKEAIFSCPKCGQKHRSLEKRTGTMRCKKCDCRFIVSTEDDIPSVQEIQPSDQTSSRRSEAVGFPPESGRKHPSSGRTQKKSKKKKHVNVETSLDNKNIDTEKPQANKSYSTSSTTNESEQLKTSPPHNWQSTQWRKTIGRKTERRSNNRLIIITVVLALLVALFIVTESIESPWTSNNDLTESQLIQIQDQIKISVKNSWSKKFSFGVDPTNLRSSVVSVEVRGNGAVENIHIVESSGDAIFDESAISAVLKAAPFDLRIKIPKSKVPLDLNLLFHPTK